MRQRRRSLTSGQQRSAAQQLLRRLARQPLFVRSRHIAFYIANDGEIDPRPLLERALAMGKHCYLPVLARDNTRLEFFRYTPGTSMQRNRYGIAEPSRRGGQRLNTRQLDLVLLPLVAFDARGGRLGMGGGYYDRSFAFKQQSLAHSPYLLGLAHHCQQVDQLTLASWDIPLHAIASDEQLFARGGDLRRDFCRTDLKKN